eukprot:Platyproteum_vivax@DN5019_c0_g1_i1.p1
MEGGSDSPNKLERGRSRSVFNTLAPDRRGSGVATFTTRERSKSVVGFVPSSSGVVAAGQIVSSRYMKQKPDPMARRPSQCVTIEDLQKSMGKPGAGSRKNSRRLSGLPDLNKQETIDGSSKPAFYGSRVPPKATPVHASNGDFKGHEQVNNNQLGVPPRPPNRNRRLIEADSDCDLTPMGGTSGVSTSTGDSPRLLSSEQVTPYGNNLREPLPRGTKKRATFDDSKNTSQDLHDKLEEYEANKRKSEIYAEEARRREESKPVLKSGKTTTIEDFNENYDEKCELKNMPKNEELEFETDLRGAEQCVITFADVNKIEQFTMTRREFDLMREQCLSSSKVKLLSRFLSLGPKSNLPASPLLFVPSENKKPALKKQHSKSVGPSRPPRVEARSTLRSYRAPVSKAAPNS